MAVSTACEAGVGVTVPTSPALSSDQQLLGPYQPLPLTVSGTLVAEIDRHCRTSFGPDRLEPWPSAPPIIDARGEGLVSIFYVDETAFAKCPGIPISADGTLLREVAYRVALAGDG